MWGRFDGAKFDGAKRLKAAMQNDRRWRLRLSRDVGWSMLGKFGLLILLWALFFSSSHRCRVDAPATANRLALTAGDAASHGRVIASGGDRCD